MPQLALDLLGPPLIRVGDEPVEEISRKPVALLAYLAVTGQPHGRDALAALLWPEQDSSKARAYLRNALWVLGKAGLEEWLEAGTETIRLRPGFQLDLANFRSRAASGFTHDHPTGQACPDCLANLRAAADLYKGGFLAGFSLRDSPEFDDWQSYQTESLRQEFSEVLERLVEQCYAHSDCEAGIAYGRRWAAHDPLHEPAHRWLMRLYAACDRRPLALKQYETLTRLLDQELGAEPDPDSRRLFEEISASPVQANLVQSRPASDARPQPAGLPSGAPIEPTPDESTDGTAAKGTTYARAARPLPLHNLPGQVTSFIGRHRDIAQVQSLFIDSAARLLTLTGPGGSGKTRLALEVAGSLLAHHPDRYPDGVFFVDLFSIDREDMVPSAVARALGMLETPGRPLDRLLKDHLRSRRLFLLLDNFEHVMGASVLVADLLAAAPHMAVLVTSREVLRLYGEQVYDVPPLELPSLDAALPELTQNEAVQLFAQRSRAARPDFTLTGQNAPLVAEICVHLDGLPLAIELAAARTGLLSLDLLRGQINDRLKALRGGPRNAHARQRTLRGTIDWSYNLLEEPEKRLFSRLAVFQGSRCIEAVEHVCMHGLTLDAAEGLESLLDKSLLRAVPGSDCEPRFSMLDTIREYALDKLEELGEAEDMRRRHARYYLELAERAEPDLKGGPRQVEWLDRLEREHTDLRAALQWSLEGGDIELGQRLAGALFMFWNRHYHFTEWEWWISRALEHKEGTPPAVRAKLLFSMGECAYFQQVPQAGVQPLREAVEIYRQLSDRHNLAWALSVLGINLGFADPGKYKDAICLGKEGLAIFRELNDQAGAAQALNILGELTRAHGDYQRARTFYEEGLALAIQIGDRLREHMMYDNLGFVAYHAGDYEQAELFFLKGLEMAGEVAVKAMAAVTLAFLGGAVGAQGRPEHGARLLAASEALLRSMAFVHQPADQVEVDRYKADLRASVPAPAFEAAWEEGRALAAHGLEHVLANVLENETNLHP